MLSNEHKPTRAVIGSTKKNAEALHEKIRKITTFVSGKGKKSGKKLELGQWFLRQLVWYFKKLL